MVIKQGGYRYGGEDEKCGEVTNFKIGNFCVVIGV
jgi:hypothetical protein